MLNVFKMRSNLARMELNGGDSLAKGRARFTAAYDRLRSRGGGTISIYYHPNEWVQTEFWDAVNFSRGANPPRSAWKAPGTRPAAETEQAFRDFEAYVRFMKAQPGVKFVTATDLKRIYVDTAMNREFSQDELRRIAAGVRAGITFQTSGDYALSAADQFELLTTAVAGFTERGLPLTAKLTSLDGPARVYAAPIGGERASSAAWEPFARSVLDAADRCRAAHRVPDEIWVGTDSVAPADYLAMLATVVEDISTSGRAPSQVARAGGRFTVDRYVAEDSPALWGWVIFPEGFHAPRIMELARLQAWTLKPAIVHR
jgi:hypothetical protein